MVHLAEYLKQLFMVDPPSGQLQTAGLYMLDADLPTDKSALLVPVQTDEDLDLQVTGGPCLTLWL